MIRVLSLGAGVQSTTVLLLSIKGQLPKLDCAIFADTGWEPMAVYQHLEWLKDQCRAADIPLYTVSAGNIKEDALVFQVRGKAADGGRWASMPYFVYSGDGSAGMIRRQCTTEYKIQPIEKFMREHVLGLKPRQRAPKEVVIEQWFGISGDEVQRMKDSRLAWKVHQYPLVGIPKRYLERVWTRHDCRKWLSAHYPDRQVPRSACLGCPFKSNSEWRHLRDSSPAEWNEVCEFDKSIRRCGGMRGDIFLHRSLMPIAQVDLRTDVELGQGDMFLTECEGMCGL